MRLKKNPKKDLNLKRGLYFVLGLLLILALIYIALEWKTPDDNGGYDVGANSNIESEINPTGVIITTNTKHNSAIEFDESIQKIDNYTVETTHCPIDDSDKKVIIYYSVDQVPIFPGCENEDDDRTCFQEMIVKHVKSNFKYPQLALNKCIEGKVYVIFDIQLDGKIGNIRTRAADKILEDEAIRIIEKLPKMKPAVHQGKEVNLPFSIPIIFKLPLQ